MAEATEGIPAISDRSRRIVAGCFLAAALAVLGIGLAVLAFEGYGDLTSRHATGTVVAIADGTTFGDDEHTTVSAPMYPVVDVTDEGRTFRFQDADGCSPPRYVLGEVVPVVYDPASPAAAAIDTGYDWLAILCPAFWSTPLFAIAWMVWPRRRSRIAAGS
jgi:hypothetical protein